MDLDDLEEDDDRFVTIRGEFPSDPDKIANLIAMIRDNKTWFNGRLDCPAELWRTGEASQTTGILVSPFSQKAGSPFVRIKDGEYVEGTADMLDMVVNRLLPAFIELSDACRYVSDTHPFRFDVVRSLIETHVRRGYGGYVIVYVGKYETDAPLRITFDWRMGVFNISIRFPKEVPVNARLGLSIKQIEHFWLNDVWDFSR